VAGGGGDQVRDFVEWGDVAAGADAGAVEGGGGAGEFELAGERPCLEQSIDEAGVEDVAGAGGVDRFDAEGGAIVELRAVVGEDAFGAEGSGGEAGVVPGADGGERFAEVGFAGDAAGDVAAGDEVIDQGEKGIDAGIELIEIGDYGDAGFAGPGGCRGCGGGVVAVEVKGAGFADPILIEIGGLEGEAIIALPEDGALAGVVDEDESLLAGAAWRGEEMRFHAMVGELGAVKGCGEVVANFADVAGAESPGLAGDHCGGNLAAGEDVGGAEFDFRSGGRELVDGDESVGGVEADTDDVNFTYGGHLAALNVKELARDAKRNEYRNSFRLAVRAQAVDATPSGVTLFPPD